MVMARRIEMDDVTAGTAGSQPSGGRRSVLARAADGADFVDLDACDLVGADHTVDLAR
jgi:hypothetical protein